jgi:hypothetical protein
VLKLWQVRDPFDPDAFFAKLRTGVYDWDDIRRLVRVSERIQPSEILSAVEGRFATLRQLTDLEHRVINDARSGWNKPLADQLRAKIVDTANRR